MLISLVDNIELQSVYNYLNAEDAGAVNFFIGTVRNHSKGKQVTKLVFEAYETMAIRQMTKLADQAISRWSLINLAIVHAVGKKKPGEPVVIIGVASAHRDASFEACRWLIDELKKTVPIWKKEYYIDNSIWVNAHP